MSLRYRLFLWIAAVFTIAFVTSYYWEERATRSSLEKTYQELLKRLDVLNEQKTKAIEDYLADMLYKIQAEVDAVLQGVAKYQLVRQGFEPTLSNLENNNWLDSSSLMITNKWVDFVQSINEEELMSEIIIGKNSLSNTLQFPIQEQVHFVAIQESEGKWLGPYIGIPLNISTFHQAEQQSKNLGESYYVFFTPETILNFSLDVDTTKSLNLSINLLEPFLKWLELPTQNFFLKGFVDQIQGAQKFLQKNPQAIPNQEVWEGMIREKLKKIPHEEECFSYFEASEGSKKEYYQEEVKYYVKEYVEHYNKVGLIWGLSTLTHSNIFGKNPLSERSPKGMGIVRQDNQCGKALLSQSVFYGQPKYLVDQALEKMSSIHADFLTTHLDIIAPEGMDHVFFGNTLQLKNGKRTGYLTVGTHGAPVLGSLSRSTHRTALFVSNNRIISVTTPEGIETEDPVWHNIPISEILSQDSGIIAVGDKDYFFLHLAPYKRIDLHFFIFTPKEEEFAFINALREEAKEIVEKISLQMRLASVGGLLFVLVLLNNISKKITRPITHLARVTETVAEGKLDDIEIPEEPKKKRRDEIYTLYHSFFEMVKGLREKERVRGILNKVVSKEIAEEALKGNIQLGGEEKWVTVLFADIRGFSNMTENMDPKEVIQLINTCMTKVSEKIDQHEGVIDKYVGDEVMALFGAPIEKPGSALSAIKSAIDMIDEIKKWNQERKRERLPEIEMGIGIHTGNVVAGNMGAENRLNYTVLGANVNLASRICSEAGGMQVLVSESTLESEGVKNVIDFEALTPVELKGFTKPVSVFSVTSYKKKNP